MAEKDAKVAAETAKEGSDEQSEVGVKKRPVKLFIFIGLIFVLLSLVVTFFVFSENNNDGDIEVAAVDPKAIYFALHPKFKTNYQVDGRPRLFQIGMTLVTREQDVIDALMIHSPSIKSRLVILLSGQQVESLQTPEGRELLRAECLSAVQAIMNKELGKPGIEKVLFTDFVMQ